MRLRDFLQYNDIVIQCHDNPDADAIGSGYGLYWYLSRQGKNVSFVYGGRYEIQKSNLVLMVEELNIPIQHVTSLSNPELLITVDCQYGEGNVQRFAAREIAVIDHHQVSGKLPRLAEVRSNLGSCATVVSQLLRQEGIDYNDDENLATALYYGLMTDTNGFTEVSHPLDRDLRDDAHFIRSKITRFRNANLSLKEMEIAGQALMDYTYGADHRFAVVEAAPCDPNILGMISDLMLEVDVVDSCLVYSVLPFGVKISVRSCIREVKASELAEYITDGIGSGGGHLDKAGGFIQNELLTKVMGEAALDKNKIKAFLQNRMENYFKNTEIIDATNCKLDISQMEPYHKKALKLGYVDPEDFFALNTKMSVRTMEGDVDVQLLKDTLIMIGTSGEIYPTTEEKFAKSYRKLDCPYEFTGEYEPTIKDILEGKSVSLIPYAKTCIATGETKVYAKQLDHRVKVFSAWDKEKYYLGKEGDYLLIRTDDPTDIYVIDRSIFEKTYEHYKE